MATRPARGRAGPDAPLAGRPPDPPAAGPAVDRPPGRRTTPELGRAARRIVADEVNVKEVVRIGDESELVERRVKPLLPRIGRKLGAGDPGGHGGRPRAARSRSAPTGQRRPRPASSWPPTRSRSWPRPGPGTAVAHDDGLVVVIDTELTDELRAEGDARELQRAIQDLRRDAGLELDDRIDLVVDLGGDAAADPARTSPRVAAETLADAVARGPPPAGWPAATARPGADGAGRAPSPRRAPGVSEAGATPCRTPPGRSRRADRAARRAGRGRATGSSSSALAGGDRRRRPARRRPGSSPTSRSASPSADRRATYAPDLVRRRTAAPSSGSSATRPSCSPR